MWKVPSSVGDVEVVRGVGSGVAPVLAGFGLATCTFLATAEAPPPAGDAALVALAAGTVALLLSMQLAFYARAALGGAVLAAGLVARGHPVGRGAERLRRQRAEDRDLFDFYYDRVRATYNAGLCLMLSASRWCWSPPTGPARWAASGLVVLAAVVELLWSFGRGRPTVARVLRRLGVRRRPGAR